MPEPTLPTLPADETHTASIDLGYRSLARDEDDATDMEPPLAIYEDEEEADSVIVPARHEEATLGEDRIRAWREIAEERHRSRKAEDARRVIVRQERRRRAAVSASAAGVLGTLLVGWSMLNEAQEAPVPDTTPAVAALDMEGAVFAAPAVAIVIPPSAVVAEAEPVVAAEPVTVAEPVVAAEPVTVAEPVVAEAEPVAASPAQTGAFDPQVISGTLNTWTADATEWLQFDYLGTGPLEIHWVDAAGQPALNPWTCDGYISRTTRRCYVGRTHERIAVALASGAATGTWQLQACDPATLACTGITTIEISPAVGG